MRRSGRAVAALADLAPGQVTGSGACGCRAGPDCRVWRPDHDVAHAGRQSEHAAGGAGAELARLRGPLQFWPLGRRDLDVAVDDADGIAVATAATASTASDGRASRSSSGVGPSANSRGRTVLTAASLRPAVTPCPSCAATTPASALGSVCQPVRSTMPTVSGRGRRYRGVTPGGGRLRRVLPPRPRRDGPPSPCEKAASAPDIHRRRDLELFGLHVLDARSDWP